MRALVVYESAWGNTKAVAEAVAGGLGAGSGREGDGVLDVETIDVQDAPALDEVRTDLLVLGAPTHAFGLSRESTRRDAHRRGGADLDTGAREWLDAATAARLRFATFDTHVRHPNLPGAASRRAARSLRRLGGEPVAPPLSFYVDDYEGPLLPGELERAREWGRGLAASLLDTGA